MHAPDSPLPGALDWELIELAKPAIEDGTPVEAEVAVRNVNRTVGGLLSSAITKRARHRGPAGRGRSASRCAARPASPSAPGSRPASS